MKIRIAFVRMLLWGSFVVMLMLGMGLLLRADWLTVTVGRISVQEMISGDDMMSYLSSAGSAHVAAWEKISRIVEEHCQENPSECAALGVSVRPQ